MSARLTVMRDFAASPERVWTDNERQTRRGWTMILDTLADTVETKQ